MLNLQAVEFEIAKHLGREEEAERIDAAREKWVKARTEELALKFSQDKAMWSDAADNVIMGHSSALFHAHKLDDAIEFKRVFDELHAKEIHGLAEWEARKQADKIESEFLLRSAGDVWGHD